MEADEKTRTPRTNNWLFKHRWYQAHKECILAGYIILNRSLINLRGCCTERYFRIPLHSFWLWDVLHILRWVQSLHATIDSICNHSCVPGDRRFANDILDHTDGGSHRFLLNWLHALLGLRAKQSCHYQCDPSHRYLCRLFDPYCIFIPKHTGSYRLLRALAN